MMRPGYEFTRLINVMIVPQATMSVGTENTIGDVDHNEEGDTHSIWTVETI
jgi:hypothetical protein